MFTRLKAPTNLDARAGTLRRFFDDWVLPRWREIAGALVLSAALAATTGGYPLIIKYSFDTLLKGDGSALPLVIGAIVVITVTRSLITYLSNVLTARIMARMMTDIQKATFAHLINSDYARLTRETTGHMVSRLTNDLGFIQGAVQGSMFSFVKDVLSAIALVVAMLYIDWMLTLIVIAIYPLAILPMGRIGKRLRSVSRRTQSQLGDMTSRLTETLGGVRLIKAFRLENHTIARLNENFEALLRLRMKAVRVRSRTAPVLETLAGTAIAAIIGFAYWRIANGVSTVGDFMGFISALLMVAQPIRSLGNTATSTMEGVAATDRLYELLDEKPKIFDRAGAQPLAISSGAIEFDNVEFSYTTAAGQLALRNFSLNVPGGKTAALVGQSGAGKTTAINLVPRLFDIGSGSIRIDGQDLRDVTLASLRDSIAIVSQEVTLFDDSIRGNIALGRTGASQADIVAAAKAAAAHDFIMAQPQGYDTVIGDSGLRLSGGQRQRLALARAILKDAPILLLDEATSALDTESELLVQEALARFTRNRTSLVIAHRLSTVQRADTICVMDAGRIIEQGKHNELLAREGAYARLCRSQALSGYEGEALEIGRQRPPANVLRLRE